jgi:hypothetical protein
LNNGDAPSPQQERPLDSAKKDNLSDASAFVFAEEKFAWLSAVVFSYCASWGKVRAPSADPSANIFFDALRLTSNGVVPYVVRARKAQYSESLLDGLRVCHNPSATHRLNVKTFRHPDAFQSYYSEEGEEWMHDQPDRLLLYRSVLTGIKAPKPPDAK